MKSAKTKVATGNAATAAATAAVEEEDSKLIYCRNFVLFVLMGCGASWIFPNALAQQIPVFQAELPGGLCIATYMNAATNFSFVASVSYFMLNKYFGPFPHSICVPILLTLGGMGAFLAAGTYRVVVNNIPIMLLICCAIGGAVGGLSNVVMNPFLTRFKNDYISASRSGSSVGTLLTALLAVVQNPGSSDNGRFSTATYLAIFGAFLCLPILSYLVVIRNRFGLRDSHHCDTVEFVEINDVSEHDCEFINQNMNIDISSDRLDMERKLNMVMSPMATRRSSSPEDDDRYADGLSSTLQPSMLSKALSKLSYSNISISNPSQPLIFRCHYRLYEYVTNHSWLAKALPYMCSIGWVNLNQWGILSAVVPFAMANISKSGGSLTLSIAYQFGAFGLLAGDLSTIYFRVPLHVCVVVFTITAFILYASALDMFGNSSPAGPPILIFIWTISRFIEAHVSTSAYRCIATEFPVEHREAAARSCGLTDQVCTTTGTIISTIIISSFGNC